MQLKDVGATRLPLLDIKMNMGYCTIPGRNRILKKRGEKDRIVYTDEETALMPGGVLTLQSSKVELPFQWMTIDMMSRTGITELRAVGQRDGVYVIRQPAE